MEDQNKKIQYDVDVHDIKSIGELVEACMERDLLVKYHFSIGVNDKGDKPYCMTCTLPKGQEYDFILCMRSVGLGRW